MRVVLAQPRGFCAGVERAIEIVERALEKYGPPIYVRHEIVHNRHVVERLRAKGAQFVDEIDEVPPGSVTIFSAHGVASEIERRAGERGLPVIDATCPLVSKVHIEGQRYANQGREIILIGHAGHPEIQGTMGRITGRVHLISRPEEVARLNVADPDKLAGGFLRSSDPIPKISATPRKTGNARRGNWRRSSMSFSSLVRRTARTRTGCARSPRNAGCRAI